MLWACNNPHEWSYNFSGGDFSHRGGTSQTSRARPLCGFLWRHKILQWKTFSDNWQQSQPADAPSHSAHTIRLDSARCFFIQHRLLDRTLLRLAARLSKTLTINYVLSFTIIYFVVVQLLLIIIIIGASIFDFQYSCPWMKTLRYLSTLTKLVHAEFL